MAHKKRIQKELDDFLKHPIANFSVNAVGDDLFNWIAIIPGPEDTPY